MTDKLTFGAPLNINDTYFADDATDAGFQAERRPEGGVELAIGAKWNGYAHRLSAAEVRQLVEFLTAEKSPAPSLPGKPEGWSEETWRWRTGDHRPSQSSRQPAARSP